MNCTGRSPQQINVLQVPRVLACVRVCVYVCVSNSSSTLQLLHTHTHSCPLAALTHARIQTNQTADSLTHTVAIIIEPFSRKDFLTQVCAHTHTRTRAAPGRRCVHTISIAARATNALHKCVLRASMRFVPYAFDTTVSSTYVRPDRPPSAPSA